MSKEVQTNFLTYPVYFFKEYATFGPYYNSNGLTITLNFSFVEIS